METAFRLVVSDLMSHCLSSNSISYLISNISQLLLISEVWGVKIYTENHGFLQALN